MGVFDLFKKAPVPSNCVEPKVFALTESIEEVCRATGWTKEEAASKLAEAKARGVSARGYVKGACWEMGEEEFEVYAAKLVARAEKKAELVAAVCEASGWSESEAKKHMAKARKLGISSRVYAKDACWSMSDEQLEAHGKMRIERADNRAENVRAVAAATGWSEAEAKKAVVKASKLGITSGQYLRKHCWDLNDAELAEMGQALEAYKPIKAANDQFYLDHVCARSGWSAEEAQRRMEDAKKNLDITWLKYAQKACWTLDDAELSRLAGILRIDAERIRANKERYATLVGEATGWSRGKVELEVAKAKVVCEASYEDYYAFKMYELTPEDQAQYVTLGHFNKMRLKYNYNRERAVAVFDDKAGFNRTFADLINRKWFVNTGLTYEQCMEEIAGLDAVLVKPLAATQGIGIQKFQVNVSEEANRAFYDTLMGLGESIVEQYVIQHEDMMGFCPTSVNTVRVTTLNFNGECRFLYSVFRMGRGSVVDNFHAGGIAATVDVDTGIVMTDAADLDSNTFATSPMTGKVIKGFQIPNWDCIQETCRKGSGRIEGVNLIGWDFAITPDGVDLIEGNPGASYVVAQIPNVKDRIGLYDQMVKPYL